MSDVNKGGGGWKGWMEGVIGWVVGEEAMDYAREVWKAYIAKVSPQTGKCRYLSKDIENKLVRTESVTRHPSTLHTND